MLNSPSTPTSAAAASRRLADLAVNALLDEVELFPKPGLVSPVDTGSHHDMDFVLMRASAESLRKPFFGIAAAGAAGAEFESDLVPLGVEAEQRMLEATRGVNTHRGAIFAMGLLIAAAARAGPAADPEAVRATLLEAWGPALLKHAGRARIEAGPRLEAASGYPSLFERALPHYNHRLSEGFAADAVAIETLFLLIASVSDTNLMRRGGIAGTAFARGQAEAFLAWGGVARDGWKPRAIKIHAEFVERNLSPGGAADLLGGTLFIHRSCSAPTRPTELIFPQTRLTPSG